MSMKIGRKSFTIVEVLASLVILCVIVGFGTFLAPFFNISNRASQKIMALGFARETMEELYSTIGIPDGAGTRPLPAGAMNNALNATRTFNVTNYGSYSVITVTVSWD